jgi:hypothetical protein
MARRSTGIRTLPRQSEGADLSRLAEAPGPGRDHSEIAGEIISERWARSFWNGGRNHSRIPAGFTPESAGGLSKQRPGRREAASAQLADRGVVTPNLGIACFLFLNIASGWQGHQLSAPAAPTAMTSSMPKCGVEECYVPAPICARICHSVLWPIGVKARLRFCERFFPSRNDFELLCPHHPILWETTLKIGEYFRSKFLQVQILQSGFIIGSHKLRRLAEAAV